MAGARMWNGPAKHGWEGLAPNETPLPPFGSQVEDFVGLDVTDEQALKLVDEAESEKP